MKLSISHIAWPSDQEVFFLKNLKDWGCSGLEIAPNRIWSEPLEAGKRKQKQFKSLVHGCGLEISAMHALLYNRNDLGLFREPAVESKTAEYLKCLCALGANLGAKVLVFGSPNNRRRGKIPFREAMERAVVFFDKVAPIAADLGVCLCIEPLGSQETDFIVSTQEGLILVDMVNNKGFGLHLDAKAVAAEAEDFSQILEKVDRKIEHFHINDPGLVEVNSTGMVDHQSLAKKLRGLGYSRYVSIEMRTMPDYAEAVKRSLALVRETYLTNSP